MEDFDNKWKSDEDYEDDYQEDQYQNEVSPPDLDENFKKNVLNVKHNLYDNIVLGPELETPDAQNNNILNDYLKNINKIYVLCLNAQKGIVYNNNLNEFPEKVREPLKQVLDWLSDYFRKNRAPDTIPYEDYIRKSFKEYQFVQNNSFNDE